MVRITIGRDNGGGKKEVKGENYGNKCCTLYAYFANKYALSLFLVDEYIRWFVTIFIGQRDIILFN
jgi:hypothetical protein